MTSWFNATSAVPEWKIFISSFEEMKVKQQIRQQQLNLAMEPHTLPSFTNPQQFLNNISLMLTEVKSYNNQMTEFLKQNIPLLIKQAIRMILQVPSINDSQQRKSKYPLQSLEFIEGLMYLPNIFNLNLLNEQLYAFYVRAIFYYFHMNLAKVQERKQEIEYQTAIYRNYFFRLFEVPYAVVECETRMGANYASLTMSVSASSSIGQQKKQSFLECLISFLDKNPQNLDLLMSNISSQSLLNCLSKILMTNGMYNYPFPLKQYCLRQLFSTKKKYVQLLSNFMNCKFHQRDFLTQKQDLEITVENILELESNIVKLSGNIYDGIKLFQLVGNLDNLKDVIYLASVNVVWVNRNLSNQPIVGVGIQTKLTDLLFIITFKDTQLYKSSSPTLELQPKMNLKDINLSIQPLLLSLKELISQKPNNKPKFKHVNLIKILNVMILNRQKYEIVDSIIIKQNILCLLVEICKKYHQMDVIINAVMDLFRGIFKAEVNLVILPANAPNLQEFKNRNDLIEEKLTAEAFKACDLILATIKAMKSHKDPMFGHFFKLAKVIKEFARNFFSTIESSSPQDMSLSSSVKIQSSANFCFTLEPLYRNDFIKSKTKEWQDFYMTNFIQLETNYLRDLGKFQQFEKATPQLQTQYTVVRLGDQKDITQSQVMHDRAQVEASMKNSIEILSMKKEEGLLSGPIEIATGGLNFKKDKGNQAASNLAKDQKAQDIPTIKSISAQLISKEEIQITSEPIKIEFRKKKTENLDESQNDSPTEQSTTEEGEESFKKFMKKKMDQITSQNRQNLRKKSKTPTKFKSSDDKTPPKMKKWGISQPEEVSKNLPKELTSGKHKSDTELENSKNHRKLSADDKLDQLKRRLEETKPLPIRIIKVNKLPVVYKQRDLDPNERDARLMAWIRG